MASLSITIPNPNTPLEAVLSQASNDDLGPLVDYLKKKLSEDLTCHEEYKSHWPNHQKYHKVIAQEIRAMGGNSFANVWRKEGPDYHEIVYDVAKKLKAKVTKKSSVIEMEDAILEKLLSDAISHMSESEQLNLLKEIDHGSVSLKGTAAMAAIKIFRMGGFKSYQLTAIIANQIAKVVLGRGLMLGTNAALMRWASILTGPVGWAISGVWTAVDIAGPAYSVTIPCVIHIAMLRKKQSAMVCEHCNTRQGDKKIKFCPECRDK
ncbi:YaaW family protein [Vibrio algivorus]|uniref:Ubiquinol-cytochrome c chaperone domain-containing protein n=1 Tax=Vibrio algivorus TaxID=1667024 RepID=A0A557PFN8_9VIBR|nr:ubiquinol-cytochrome C chaperone family protein [Vibrio algivorus]TVO39446.1 hypothetical protein FOF44_02340 [Vibrio algivorus]